jgi:hypothetical protein
MHVIPNLGERDPANRSNARKSTVENLQTCRTNEIAANGIALLPYHLRVPAMNRQPSFIAIAKTDFRKEYLINEWLPHLAPNACIRLPLRHAVGEGWGEVVLGEQGTKFRVYPDLQRSLYQLTTKCQPLRPDGYPRPWTSCFGLSAQVVVYQRPSCPIVPDRRWVGEHDRSSSCKLEVHAAHL